MEALFFFLSELLAAAVHYRVKARIIFIPNKRHTEVSFFLLVNHTQSCVLMPSLFFITYALEIFFLVLWLNI